MSRLGVIHGDGGGDWCQDTMVRKLGSCNVIIFGMIFCWIQSLLALFSQGYSQCRLKRSVLSTKWVVGDGILCVGRRFDRPTVENGLKDESSVL
ncbi:unnamed protein product [Trifolium pratense]|uniref:Uncharacterized protein n=1 Tax=Trifolium pratense TaxID=57577 RepID=A0ACB0LFU5_TRIPR|nr:unnamed protein product [Trifolium pratense]